jgi:acetyltransferase-like isoleucine patch superfamily enzyme
MNSLYYKIFKYLLVLRGVFNEGPSTVYYSLFWWFYPAKVLRNKAASCPYAGLRKHILRLSGIPIGEEAEVGYGTLVLGLAKNPPAVVIGDRVAIAPYVTFITSSYPDNSRLNHHPDVLPMIQKLGPIKVENDVWIGAGVIIFPDVTLGHGCIVGSGALVMKDVPPYTIVAGRPAKIIRTLSVQDLDSNATN